MEVFVLILGLIFPRIALLIGWLSQSILPNPFPFWADVVLAFLVPRILFITYIVINFKTLENSLVWLLLHIGAAIFFWFRELTKD